MHIFLTPFKRPSCRSRVTILVTMIWLLGLVGLPLRIVAQTPGAPADFRRDRFLVKPIAGADLAPLHRALGVRVIRSFAAIENLQVLQTPPGADVDAVIAAYRASGFVAYAERDYIMRLQATPNDLRYLNGDLWNLHNTGLYGGVPGADIDAPGGWDVQQSAANIVVAVVDTGIRLTHEDLAPNLWINPGESGAGMLGLDKRSNFLDDDDNGFVDDVHGINAVAGNALPVDRRGPGVNATTGGGIPADDHGHGTHVSGTIGARGNNSLGVVGVAWQVQLMACKAFDAAGNGAMSDLITCIDYARAKHANIINASWGHYTFNSSALYDAIARVRRDGILFITVAGNFSSDNDLNPLYPANFALDNIIVVAATDRADGLAGFSNYGAQSVHLAAPGSPVFSCWIESDADYRYYSGTSMAVPHVVGACALIWARNPGLTYLEVKSRVLGSVDTLSALTGKTITGGRLNLKKALSP